MKIVIFKMFNSKKIYYFELYVCVSMNNCCVENVHTQWLFLEYQVNINKLR